MTMAEDRGCFYVHRSDVPLRAQRRKNKRGQQKSNRKKARLTPINEHEENILERDASFSSSDREGDTPFSLALSGCQTDRSGYTDAHSERSDTPVRKSYTNTPRMYLDLDTFEEELENIPEDGDARLSKKEIQNVLRELPPRPKCKRKVLPPSVTSPNNDQEKPRKNKLLKLRAKAHHKLSVDSISQPTEYSVSKDLQRVLANQTLRLLNERDRPKSAENKVRVIKLGDLSALNSTSVPDLPSIMESINRHNELSKSPLAIQSARSPDTRSIFDDSGALSTPREEDKVKSLRGSDMSSFYNMWERDAKKRPFAKKELDKGKGIQYNRSCMCSLKNCMKNSCGLKRLAVLPPISSPE